MNNLATPPPRSEDDLRAALTALETRAPSTEAVLAAVRERTSLPGRPRLPRAARSPRWRGLALGAVAAAAAAGVVIALLPGGPSAGHGGTPVSQLGPAAQTGLPSAASVGKAMLTAYTAANDEILYAMETGINDGVTVDVYQDWSMPAQPVTGQPERWRNQFSQRLSRTAPLKLTEDDGFDYIVPPAQANYVDGQLTVVCYSGTGQSGCGYGNTETLPGTWAKYHGRFVNVNPGLDDLSPASLAREIAAGQWRVIGRTHLDGQLALELSETSMGSYRPLPYYLWVNAHSYLPLRMVQGAGASVSGVNTWSFLKSTPVNLNLLNVPVPSGYPRSNSTRG
jgi:hypothetical protein